MRILAAIHALLAAALLLMGFITTFSIGLTGLVFLLGAAVFAAAAGVAATGSRAAVLLTLALDAGLAAFAVSGLMAPGGNDVVVSAVILALLGIAFIAVLLDWRNVMARRWFEEEGAARG